MHATNVVKEDVKNRISFKMDYSLPLSRFPSLCLSHFLSSPITLSSISLSITFPLFFLFSLALSLPTTTYFSYTLYISLVSY